MMLSPSLLRATVGALALAALFLGPVAQSQSQAHAQAQTPALSAEDRADIARVEQYFNGLSTLRSTFLQASSTGHVARGIVWLSRPGRMRFEYAPPSPVLITADGFWLTYQDNELEQTTQIPLGASPLGVLVDEDVSLTGDLVVEQITRQANVLRVRLRQRDDPDQGTVVLAFQNRPLSLKQWVITDSQGVEVKVSLLDPVFGLDLPASLWRPNDFEAPADQIGR